MKIDFIDNNLIVFLNKQLIKEIDFYNEIKLENYFRKLFQKIKDIYDIEINGSYEIGVYIDDSYGVILKIIKNESEYFDYYDNQVDMSITISKQKKFLYKIRENINKKILSKCDIYLYQNDFYILPLNCNYIDLGYIIENCDIIYGSVIPKIINGGKKINIMKFLNSLFC